MNILVARLIPRSIEVLVNNVASFAIEQFSSDSTSEKYIFYV